MPPVGFDIDFAARGETIARQFNLKDDVGLHESRPAFGGHITDEQTESTQGNGDRNDPVKPEAPLGGIALLPQLDR